MMSLLKKYLLVETSTYLIKTSYESSTETMLYIYWQFNNYIIMDLIFHNL